MKNVVCVLLSIMLAGSVISADLYVDVNATGANDGSSWADAWTSLDTPMLDNDVNNDYVSDGDIIHVAAGTYIAPMDGWTPEDDSLTLQAEDGDEVILSGDINQDDTFADLKVEKLALETACTSGDHIDNANHIFNVSDKTFTLDGFTIEGAKSGAIECSDTDDISYNTNITITNCLFTQNYCESDDGACINFGDAEEDDDDEEIPAVDGTLIVTHSRFIQNCSYKRGAAIHHRQAGTVSVDDCFFSVMVGIDNVGTIYLRDRCYSATITNSIFDRCMMVSNAGGSMGIMTWFDADSHVTVENCLFTNCESYHNGAAVYARCDIDDADVTVDVKNCLITESKNYEPVGDCVALFAQVAHATSNASVTLNITNCTVADNHTNDQGHVGGAVESGTATVSATVNLKNSIIWGNTGDSDGSNKAQIYLDTTAPGSSRVFIHADYCCWDNTDPNDYGYAGVSTLGSGNLGLKEDPSLNPQLDAFYMLSAGSDCIDAGKNSYISLATDLSDRSRKSDDPDTTDTGDGTAPIVDMGAYEFYELGDISGDGSVDTGDLDVLASQWLEQDCAMENKWCRLADMDVDGDVDLADFNVLAIQWLQ